MPDAYRKTAAPTASGDRWSHLGQSIESDQVVNWTESEHLLPHTLAVAGQGQKLEVESER
jgi:hypothetical protein